MSEHVAKYTKSFAVDATRPYWAQCGCGQNSGWCATKQECQDWEIRHQAQVQRARAALTTRTPALMDQWKWYVQCAEDPSKSWNERQMWTRLAEELEGRLKSDDPTAGQDPLF